MAPKNYFKDQDIEYAEVPKDDDNRFGSDISRNMKELQVGAGSNVLRANESGLWLGAAKWKDAPFRVDMLGNVVANSIALTGFIAVGGAAADVNANSTTISGGKITTNSLNASKIVSGSITALQIQAGTITATQLNFVPVDSTNVVASINASVEGIKITGARVSISGLTTFASGYDPSTKFATSDAGDLAYLDLVEKAKLGTTVISGGYILTSLLTASNIQTGTLNASVVSVTNLNATNITTGTLKVGGASQPTELTVANSTTGGAGTTVGFLNWKTSAGTLKGKIWADTSGYMGYNAIGGRHYFYTNDNENVVIQDGVQTIFQNGVSCRGAFNVTSGNDARIAGGFLYFATSATTQSIYGGNANRLEYNANTYHYLNIGGNLRLRLSDAGLTLYNGYLYQPDSHVILHGAVTSTLPATSGTLKNAIVPTSKGFNALACIESPEVWFMDFIKDRNSLDPMFEEVTESPYHYVKCEDGGYQVWGRRKGFRDTRFESKTEDEFRANERFLNLNKSFISKK